MPTTRATSTITVQWLPRASDWVARVVDQTDDERDDRADREVDAAAGDHERHADRDHADHRGEPQDRQGVVDAGELLARGGDARRGRG